MRNFACRQSFEYRDYPYGFSLPEDLYEEDYQMPEVEDSLKDDLLGDSYENSYLLQDYWNNRHEIDFNGFHSEALQDAQFPMACHWPPNHDVSSLKFFQPDGQTDLEDNFDRIPQVWSTLKLPKDFNEHSNDPENNLIEEKNFGSYAGRSKNLNFMEKDSAHIFENVTDHFSSGHSAPKKLFEDFPYWINTYADDLRPSLCQSERQKQNSSMTAETEVNYSHLNCWNHGEQLKSELQQVISSLTAHVSRLEIQVEHLTHRVQDMADKITAEKKLISPNLHRSDERKAVLEESEELISSADEAAASKLFIQTEDPSQKQDDSCSSASDWEIL